jgi:kumamolisin
MIIPVNLDGGIPGRAIPDVSAVADPATGYAVFANLNWQVVGGTSAVAPLYAGLLARINVALGKPAGLINPALYAADMTNGFNDITIGNNSYGGTSGYAATASWDATTGWGTPGGMALLNLLAQPPGDSGYAHPDM